MSFPVLYRSDEINFTSRGMGALRDAIRCAVTEERNGIFELEAEYPLDGIHYGDLEPDRIILAPANDIEQWQPFRIYSVRPSLAGTALISAEHVSYQLNHIGVAPFTAQSAAATMQGLRIHAYDMGPFTLSTDITATRPYKQDIPSTLRQRLGGEDGSMLDVYGGELEFDRWSVKLLRSRGQDRNVIISYGKNLTTLEQEIDIASMFTGIYPYYYRNDSEQGDILVQLPEQVITVGSGSSYHRIKVIDFTGDFDDTPTIAQLRSRALTYLNSNRQTAPKVSLQVSFAALWQTEEYKNIAPLERVGLCDIVTVRYPKLGVDTTAKVVRTVYDCLADRYESLELGEARQGLDTTVAGLTGRIAAVVAAVERSGIKCKLPTRLLWT